MSSIIHLSGDGTYTYGYDAENRLVSATGAGNTASYAYDGRGQRKGRTVNGTTTISVTDTDNREVLEYDGSTGAVLRWYAYSLGPNDVLNQMNVPGGTRSVFLPDIQDSVIATYSSAGVLAKSAYQPYGGSAAPASPFAYTGQRIEPEAGGLYYYRARHYSSVFGRFLQADPVGYSAGPNLYAYVINDPLNLVDRLGLVPSSSSVAQNLAQGTINLVPGAYYGGLAQQQYQQENYFAAGVYGVASLLDAGLGVATFGLSTRLGSLIRAGEATIARTATETAAKPFAMGLEGGLDAFASARGATTWKDFADPTKWKSGVIEKLSDPNTTVHFNLQGVDVWGGVGRAAAGRGGATDWELMQIRQNPQWWDTMQFWMGKSPASNPFVK